jgi:hypothetical protein
MKVTIGQTSRLSERNPEGIDNHGRLLFLQNWNLDGGFAKQPNFGVGWPHNRRPESMLGKLGEKHRREGKRRIARKMNRWQREKRDMG